MNRFLFLLSGLMLGITMVAAPVSKTAAQEKARRFMLERGMIADGTAVEEYTENTADFSTFINQGRQIFHAD